MAEYNPLLSLRVAMYAGEINRLTALVAKLQRMQLGISSEKLREKMARLVCEAEEHIGALQEEMAEVPGEQHDPVLLQPLRHSSARKPPVRLAAESSAHWAATCRISWSSSAAPLRSSKRSKPKLACCSCDTSSRRPCSQNLERNYAGPGLLTRIVTAKFSEHMPHYHQSVIYSRRAWC